MGEWPAAAEGKHPGQAVAPTVAVASAGWRAGGLDAWFPMRVVWPRKSSVQGRIAACLAVGIAAGHPAMAGPDDVASIGERRAAEVAARVRPLLKRGLAEAGLRVGDPVFVRAFKEERVLELWMQPRGSGRFRLFRTYPVAAQSGTLGPKLAEGDGQVPEGFYHVTRSRMKPDSAFHLAFDVGFPNEYDRHHGRTGSFIMIHGGRASVGCLAMTDPGIEEIYTLCDAALVSGQRFFRVHLFPFRLTETRLGRERDNRWLGFWDELRDGFLRFERDGVPPDVNVRGGRYVFGPE